MTTGLSRWYRTALGRQNNLEARLCIISLCAFAIAQPVYDLLAQYPAFFVARHSEPADIIALVLVLSILIPMILITIGLILGRLNQPASLIYSILLVFTLAGVFALPIVKQNLVSTNSILAMSIMLALVILLLYLVSSVFRQFLGFLAISAVVFPVLFLLNPQIQKIILPAAAPAGSPASQSVHGSAPASTPPIIMLVLDELPYTSLLDENANIDQERYPNIARLASEANWFTNATAVSDGTVYAVPAILASRYPTKDLLPSTADYPENLFSWLGKFYSVHAIESATRLCPDTLCSTTRSIAMPIRLKQLFIDINYIYLHALLPGEFTGGLPDISHGWGNFEQSSVVKMEAFSTIQEWNEAISAIFKADRMELFQQFLQGISKDDQPAIDFLHILFPHVPYEFFPTGKRYFPSDLPKITNERWELDDWAAVQAYQRSILQLGYLDRMIGQLVQRLKDTGLYEQSLIVIVADHGAGFHAGDYRRPVSVQNAADILPVPLIIKAPHQTAGKSWDNNVETVDILPSIAELLGLAKPNFAQGESVFAARREKPAEKHFYSYLSQQTTVYPQIIPGIDQALRRKLALFGSGDDPLRPFALGPYRTLAGKRLSELNIVQGNQFSVAIEQGLMFKSIITESPSLPARLTGVFSAKDGIYEPVNFAVAVNGIIVATGYSFNSEVDQFSIMIPEQAFTDGENTLQIFTIIERDGEPVLETTTELKQALRSTWQIVPLLKKEFESAAVQAFKMTPENLSSFTAQNELAITSPDGELLLQSSGRDPYLLLPEFPLKPGFWHIVRIKIESPGATQLQIYYRRNSQTEYNSEDSLVTNLAPGENEVYLKIWETTTVGRVRLDPGMLRGSYRIKELEVRAVEAPKKKQAERFTPATFPMLAKAFDSARQSVFRMTEASIPAFKPLNDITVNRSSTELNLTATGTDPYLQLPEFDWAPNSAHLIKLVLISPINTQLQFYYQVNGNLKYSQENSVITNLVKGRNEVYLSIDSTHAAGRLRLDPGMIQGQYVIRELEIRSVAPNLAEP